VVLLLKPNTRKTENSAGTIKMLRTILRPSTSTFNNKKLFRPLTLLNSRTRQPYSVQQQPQTNASVISQYRDRQQAEFRARNRSLLLYAISIGVVTLGLSYAAVPLYRAFCSATGYNGTPSTSSSRDGTGKFAPDRIAQPVGLKTITVRFNADKSDTLDWKFWPCQKSLSVKPGETVLAFYKAKNLSDHDLLGVATYNVTPGQVHHHHHHLSPCLKF
jgi:cytochrome c oxidase assembly protein subunit 11